MLNEEEACEETEDSGNWELSFSSILVSSGIGVFIGIDPHSTFCF